MLTNTVSSVSETIEKLVHELAGAPFTLFTERVGEGEDEAPKDRPKVATSIKYGTLDAGLRTKVLIEVNEDYHDA